VVEAANYICLCEQMMPIRMDLSFQTKMAETLLLIKCLKYMSISKTFFIALAYLNATFCTCWHGFTSLGNNVSC